MRRNLLIAAIVLFIVAPVAYMVFDRETPYDFVGVTIEPQEAKQGGEIYITFKVRENRPACGPGLVYREFKEKATGKLHLYDPVQRAAPPDLSRGEFTRISRLPDHISLGLVEYRGAACYNCNPLQAWLRWPVCTTTPPVSFTVVGRD